MFPMLMNLLAERPEISDDGQPITWLGIGEGLVYALIGFIVTFLGVALLIFFVWAYGRIIKGVTPGVTAWNKKYQAKKSRACSRARSQTGGKKGCQSRYRPAARRRRSGGWHPCRDTVGDRCGRRRVLRKRKNRLRI